MFSDTINFWNESKKNKILILFYAMFLAFFILLYQGRAIIHKKIDERISVFNQSHKGRISVENIYFDHLNIIEFQNIAFIPNDNDTLTTVGYLKIKLNFFKLLTGKIVFKEIFLDKATIRIHIDDSTTNYDFFKPIKQNVEKKDLQNDYYETSKTLLNTLFDKIPSNLVITNFLYSYITKNYKLKIRIPHFTLKENKFKTLICTKHKSKKSFLEFTGVVDKKNKSFDISLNSISKDTFYLPFLKFRYETKLRFDSLKMIFTSKEFKNNILKINALFFAKNTTINNPKIATSNVMLNNIKVSFLLNITPNYIEVDSLSEIVVNNFGFQPYILYKKGKYKDFFLEISKPDFNAKELFAALPQGLFVNFNGFDASGVLSYHMFFHVNTEFPDSLIFESELKSNHFRIMKFGETNFSYFNESFVYTPYEKGIPIRDILISNENQFFTPLSQISPHIINALLTSEDGAFFNHRGFLLGSFKEAIAENIKREKFVRGGSTISMQLVKNLFLSRSKTIARKLEEMLIVWLIENNGLSSKERMLEVYLNIIEWGPNVYGIGEASKFYFNKKPSQINLSEAIYLASIVPRPKKFMYTFDKQGVLRDFVVNYYNFVGERMLKYERITQLELDNLQPIKEFKGPAKNYILKTDSIPMDSLNTDNPFF